MATENLRAKATLDTKNFERGAKRMANANKNIKRSGGSASAAIIELGRGASDARFGFVGLGNNLERTTELFGSLVKNSGGLKGALKSVGSALLGPAGLVAGITILIAYGLK